MSNQGGGLEGEHCVQGVCEEKSSEYWQQRHLMIRRMLLVTKAAYHFGNPRWLVLCSQLMEELEQCPVTWRESLKKELTLFHKSWSHRPKRGELLRERRPKQDGAIV